MTRELSLPNPAVVAAYEVEHAITTDDRSVTQHGSTSFVPPTRPSDSRLESSRQEEPFCLERFVEEARSKPSDETVLYLAYGSNLSAQKFRKDRDIQPLSQINVVVPSLRMTFDLPGIPYVEPCFANSARRDPDGDASTEPLPNNDEKSALLPRRKYRKDAWRKGLVGVVYEVTPADYAHIIATEGGGSEYQDIVVECHPLTSSDPRDCVPERPTNQPFKAHTLFAPAIPEGKPGFGRRTRRPDPAYAQSSARYLKLITDGAAELCLPYEYQNYLLAIRAYTPTTLRQRIGKFVITATWLPAVFSLFRLTKFSADDKGKMPPWLAGLVTQVFNLVWKSYDWIYKPLFGDGERTIGDDGETM